MDLAAARTAAARAERYLTDLYLDTRLGRTGEWRNEDVRAEFLAALRSIVITVVDATTVRAEAPDTHNGRLRGYLAGDALRKARGVASGTVARIDARTFTLTLNP